MYPSNPKMDFECDCPLVVRKNIWNDIKGIHVRYCPMCNERREQSYKPVA